MLVALLVLAASPAYAQLSNPGGGAAPDLSGYATVGQVQDASSAAASAQSLATSALTAIPPACVVAPTGDTLNGTVGNGTPCTPPVNNTRPTAVQAGNTTLAADCSFSISFARAFTSSVPFVYAAVVNASGGVMPCTVSSRSSTTAAGKCQGAQPTVLSLSLVTTGLTLLPFGTSCTAGTPVMFVGREPTQ